LTGIKNWLIAVLLFLMALPSAAYCQKLRVGTLYIGSTMLPLWIAREEGYFASRGFDVELIWLQSTLSTMALIAGEADSDLRHAPRNASGHGRQERSSINHRRVLGDQLETLARCFTEYPIR
jgi:hypothetical protein